MSDYIELKAYRKYIEDNLERIEQGGWTPICFAEFVDSEECEILALQAEENEWAYQACDNGLHHEIKDNSCIECEGNSKVEWHDGESIA